MRYVLVKNLEPDMVLGQEIYDSDGRLLLSKHTVLNEDNISFIIFTGVPGVYIDEEFSEDAKAEEVVGSEVRRAALRIVHDVFIKAGRHEAASEKELSQVVDRITDDVISDNDVVENLITIRTHDGYTYFHSVDVAILSGVLGARLGLNEQDLRDIVTAGFLHDVGKVFISEDILNAPRKLTPDERTKMMDHPRMGYDFLKDKYNFNEHVLQGVYQHHEWFNGGGYPRRIAGNDILFLARIIKVADVYDAMTGKRSYHNPYLPSDVLEYIMGRNGMEFDPVVVHMMSRELCVYPVGCEVELSNGFRAVVLANRRGSIMRPKVKIRETGEEIDLTEDRKAWNLTITKLLI
ncbi:MAG: HD-GYP domain-containing protein [bacterium LCO1.1]|uniref:HD-GYP domain-containing protein n=1 Tax=Candidatus Weimeria bifida TaxID=2599074 RepID=A0A6N7IY42_9FIRM|nr:HD-GYP domain-containing protein [Candidatus Weimeria bifida]